VVLKRRGRRGGGGRRSGGGRTGGLPVKALVLECDVRQVTRVVCAHGIKVFGLAVLSIAVSLTASSMPSSALSTLSALSAFSASADSATPSSAGAIRGRVELRQPAADHEPRPNVAELRMPGSHGATDRRRSVVYLDPGPRAAFDLRDEPHARMDQRSETFIPHVLAIMAGATVDFPNNDRTYHNVFSLSKTKSFDLGRYAAGRSKSIRFDKPGIVRVFCDIHSHMSAYILVFSHPYFAVTDEQGRYRIDGVPPGTYNVVAWNEAMETQSRRVTVPESGDTDVDFVLSRQ
jgi:plastocyanin